MSVLLYHAEMPWMPGGFVGVDIFFVVSGFLITGGIVNEFQQHGRFSLKDFYVRRMARILPAATVTIVTTVFATWLLLPETRWEQIGRQAFASGLYFVNWLFAQSAVDYLSQDQAPSPLLHFWSLAVEEQFYIVWPLLLTLAGWLTFRTRLSLHKSLLSALALIAVPSLAWSIYYTAADPGRAYYVTTTRMWELAVGAGLAILLSRSAVPSKLVAGTTGWVGLAAVLVSAFQFSGALPFPSYTALLPVLGATALIWGGQVAGSGPGRLLCLPAMVWVGGISYSLYLWHWPLLVITAAQIGELSPHEGLFVVLAAMVPAWLSTRFIEKPAQRFILGYKGRGRLGPSTPKLAIGATISIVGVIPALLLILAVPSGSDRPKGPIGAETLSPGETVLVVDSFSAITPAPVNAATDLPAANTNGCMLDHPTVTAKVCSYGDLDSSKVIALVGDSHAAMHIPSLKNAAKRSGYRLDTYTKGSCPFVTVPISFAEKDYPECREWAQNVADKLVKDQPSLAITAMSRAYQVHGSGLSIEESKQPIADSMVAIWAQLEDAGIRVAAIRSVPRPEFVVPDCVAENPDNLSECSFAESTGLWSDGAEIRATQADPQAALIDLTPEFCGDGRCPAVIGSVLVYRDSNHLTATYSRTLHRQMSEQLAPLLRSGASADTAGVEISKLRRPLL